MSMTRTVDALCDAMTNHEKAGQMVMGLNAPGWPGISDIDQLIRDYHLGSVISCGYRSLDPTTAAEQNNALQRLAGGNRLGIPLLNAGDFEQGAVSQIPSGVTDLPQQMGIGAIHDRDAAEQAARIAGVELKALGFQWTFSPAADVNLNPDNPVIGVRSFGDDPTQVAEMTAAQIRGYRAAGILSTAKHFPGHGAASVDSHLGLPLIATDRATLERIHFPPFVAAIQQGVDAVMTAHVVVPSLDPDLPATLSPRVLTDILRDELGFQGIIITDLMTMGAIATRWEPEEAAVRAVLAGADIVLAGGTTELPIRTIQALVRAMQEGTLAVERVDASVRRVLAAKERLGLFERATVETGEAESIAGSPDHLALADDLTRRSVTLIKNEGILPFDPRAGGVTLVAGITNVADAGRRLVSHVPVIAEMVRNTSAGTIVAWQAGTDDPNESEIAEATALARTADRIIVLTYAQGALPAGQARLVRALLETNTPLVAIALGTPYDLLAYPEVRAYLACYALPFVSTYLPSSRAIAAAVRVIFGQQPEGHLPVGLVGQYARGHGLRYSES